MRVRERLSELRLELPEPFVYPSTNRTGCIVTGDLCYTSGHPPPDNFGVKTVGKVGADLTEEEAYAAARATALNILASVERKLGSLDRITQVVKVFGMVNSAPGFQRQFAAIDGASDLFFELFGPQVGQHARSAVGMFELPRGFCMEIEAIFELG
ncbi:MAG: RidA family protein [Rhodospirillaceae bacterium]